MPLTIEALHQLPGEPLQGQIAHLYDTSPEFADGHDAVARLTQALAAGDTLYLAMFNEKPIGAIWARRTEQPDTRLMQYIVVHPANRGRGIAEALVKEGCAAEEAKGAQHFKPGCGAIHRLLARQSRLG